MQLACFRGLRLRRFAILYQPIKRQVHVIVTQLQRQRGVLRAHALELELLERRHEGVQVRLVHSCDAAGGITRSVVAIPRLGSGETAEDAVQVLAEHGCALFFCARQTG